MVGEEEADKPEEDVDVGEKEDVGEEERVVEAPAPEVVGRGRGGRGAVAVVVEEGEVEEDGRERGEKGNGGVLEASHGDFFRGWVDRGGGCRAAFNRKKRRKAMQLLLKAAREHLAFDATKHSDYGIQPKSFLSCVYFSYVSISPLKISLFREEQKNNNSKGKKNDSRVRLNRFISAKSKYHMFSF